MNLPLNDKTTLVVDWSDVFGEYDMTTVSQYDTTVVPFLILKDYGWLESAYESVEEIVKRGGDVVWSKK